MDESKLRGKNVEESRIKKRRCMNESCSLAEFMISESNQEVVDLERVESYKNYVYG
jgi:hypothetical protein